MNDRFMHIDTKAANGVYVRLTKELVDDCDTSPTDFDCYEPEDVAAFNRGEWSYIGVRAVAHITVVINGVGTIYRIKSAGCYGIESHAGAIIDDHYKEECDTLLEHLAMFGTHTVVECE